MYATKGTYVSTRAVYQMHHTEILTVDPLIRTAEWREIIELLSL
jgi:hypothetical protein